MISQFYSELGETLYRETLPNGLTVAVLPRKNFSKKLAYFVTDYGSVHTAFTFEGQEHHVPEGVAHYLEHKLFDMPGGRDVSAEFAAHGANVNAFTSYDVTAYYFSCTSHFEENLRLLVEFVSTPYFTEETVEKERGIIDQEIGMCADNPDHVCYDNVTKALFDIHPIRQPILGTRETIRQITPEILHLVHRAFYTPGNMMLCVVGDVEPEQVSAIARELLGEEKREVGIKLPLGDEPMESACHDIRQEMEVALPSFTLAFKSEPLGLGEQETRKELVAELACTAFFGESSPLYNRLYEAGTIDSSFGGGFETYDGCAMITCGGECLDPEAVREAILQEAERIAREGIPDEDFQRLRRSTLGRMIRNLDSFDATCYRICACHLSGVDYFRFPELHRSIEKQELTEFLTRVITRERSCLSQILPIQKEET